MRNFGVDNPPDFTNSRLLQLKLSSSILNMTLRYLRCRFNKFRPNLNNILMAFQVFRLKASSAKIILTVEWIPGPISVQHRNFKVWLIATLKINVTLLKSKYRPDFMLSERCEIQSKVNLTKGKAYSGFMQVTYFRIENAFTLQKSNMVFKRVLPLFPRVQT